MPKNEDNYIGILADFYNKTGNKDFQKLDIIKASHLYDKSKDVSFENLEEKFNTIIKKHIKRDSYFKIKLGIFGTKSDIDSSFFENKNAKEIEQTQVLIEENKKRDAERKRIS